MTQCSANETPVRARKAKFHRNHIFAAFTLAAVALARANPAPPDDPATHISRVEADRMRIGVQVKIENFDPADATLIRSTGFTFVRFGVWTDHLSDPAYQKRVADAFSHARDAGLPVLLTVRSTRPIISVQTEGLRRDIALTQSGIEFGQGVAALLREHASQLIAVEIWNEPDLPKYWPTGDVTATFGPYLQAACRQWRIEAAKVPVLGFAFSRPPLPGSLPDTLLQQVMEKAPGCIHAVSYHAYGMSAEAIRDASIDLRARYGLAAVVTEWGSPSIPASGGTAGQAARVRTFLATLPTSGTPLASIYEWKDTITATSARERNFGLVTSDGAAKPALDAARDALRLIEFAGSAAQPSVARGNGNR